MSRTQNSTTGRPAVVAKRVDTAPADTTEISALTSAAGYAVVTEVTQVRPEDPGTYFGSGTLDRLAATAREHAASLVVVDGELTPSQHLAIQDALPEDTILWDRYRLVLCVFGEGAGTKRAKLQVELETLRYDLPRVEREADGGRLNKVLETGMPQFDIRKRIDRIERKLDELPDPADRFRSRRREDGFDLLTIAGYTNAGKSTLLHRLSDELCLASALGDGGSRATEREPADGSMKDATAAVEDRLFKTLETTTRRATIDGRPVLATDTVGFVDDLPHDLVASFSATLSEAAAADVVVLVVDGSDPLETFRRRLEVSLDILDELDVADEQLVTAVNKVDLLSPTEADERMSVASEAVSAPIPISVHEGTGIDDLRCAIAEWLPTVETTLEVRNCDDAMALVSEAYDRTTVDDVTYDGDRVTIACRGRPGVIERLEAQAVSMGG